MLFKREAELMRVGWPENDAGGDAEDGDNEQEDRYVGPGELMRVGPA
jgi:hypothetical protein